MDSQETYGWGQHIGRTSKNGKIVVNGTSNYIAHVAVAYIYFGQLNVTTPQQLTAEQLTIEIPIDATQVAFMFSTTGGLNKHQPHAGLLEKWNNSPFITITLSGRVNSPEVKYTNEQGVDYKVVVGSSAQGDRISKA